MKFLNSRKLMKWHRKIGLFLAMNLIILNLTGTILIWKEEILSFSENENISRVEKSLDANIQRALELLNKDPQLKNKKILSVFPDDKNSNWLNLRVSDVDNIKFRGATKLIYLIFEDQLIKKEDITTNSSTIMTFILDLHKELLFGARGKYLNALIGLFLIFLIISGLVYAQKTKFSKVTNIRMKLGQLHKKIGVYTSLWFFAIVLTGVLLSLNATILTLYFKSEITKAASGSQVYIYKSFKPFEIAKMIEDAKSELGEFEIDYISFPGNEFSVPNKFVLIAEEKDKINANKKLVFVDRDSLKPTAIINLPLLLETLIFSEIIHFGSFGGVFTKILWTILSIVTGIIPVTGLAIFYYRNKKRGIVEN